LQKRTVFLYLPLAILAVLGVLLYSPDVPVTSNLTFLEKTSLFAAFAFAAFAAVESYATYDHAAFEKKRYKIEDARNELEKAYGPLYSILNKAAVHGDETKVYWLEFEDRKKANDLLATYPFMFSSQINELRQEKIQKLGSMIETSTSSPGKYTVNLEPYADLRRLINEEYARKVKNYRELLEK